MKTYKLSFAILDQPHSAKNQDSTSYRWLEVDRTMVYQIAVQIKKLCLQIQGDRVKIPSKTNKYIFLRKIIGTYPYMYAKENIDHLKLFCCKKNTIAKSTSGAWDA